MDEAEDVKRVFNTSNFILLGLRARKLWKAFAEQTYNEVFHKYGKIAQP